MAGAKSNAFRESQIFRIEGGAAGEIRIPDPDDMMHDDRNQAEPTNSSLHCSAVWLVE
jgi:hypothetical protein